MNNIFEILEEFKGWTYDNGVVYFTGRDIYAMIIGALISLVVCLVIYALIDKEGE